MRYRVITIGLASALLGACGGADDPITCSPSERAGTYLLTYETLSGNCGNLPQTVVRLEGPDQGLIEGCALDVPDRWSEDGCKVERAFTCLEPAAGDGATSEFVGVTTQETDDGSRISGTMTARLFASDGSQTCLGTYRLAYERQ
jgi:hypothetical protein